MSSPIVAHPNADTGRAAAAARLARQGTPAIFDTAPINYEVNGVRFTVVREASGFGATRTLSDPDAVAALARGLIPDDAREHFGVFMLNAQNSLIAYHEVSTGTLSASLVHPREVFGPALCLLGVASLVLVHNHPSDDPEPAIVERLGELRGRQARRMIR